MKIIAQLLKSLNPGGVIVLHFPVRRRLPPLELFAYSLKHQVPFARYGFKSAAGKTVLVAVDVDVSLRSD
jgi:hypothetical protein